MQPDAEPSSPIPPSGDELIHEIPGPPQMVEQPAALAEWDAFRPGALLQAGDYWGLALHELRSSLACIRKATESLRLLANQPLQLHAISVIERHLTQLSRQLSQFVGSAKLRRATVRMEDSLVEFSDLISKAMEPVKALIDERQHNLYVSVPPEPALLRCDPDRLVQMIEKLLDNAARFTDPGGKILVTIRSDDQCLLIEVADNGSGIAPELLPDLYNVFAHHDSPSPSCGLGLGLPVVRQLVDMHRGTIEAHSEGTGSTFTIRLPLQGAINGVARSMGSESIDPSLIKGVRLD